MTRTDNGPAYRAYGAETLWQIVPGKQVPQTCLRRARSPGAHERCPAPMVPGILVSIRR
ncbi:hypothetical protein ABT187_43845 [Streptomyces sp. NPDC001817]|uniref:hypothetical protein n=1 Tax=Streptomyces sp. NPDC001817 TaxID=3154398 RepID=UPI00332A09F5